MIEFTVRQLTEYGLCLPVLRSILETIAEDWPADRMYLSRIWSSPDENPRGATQIHVVGPPYRAIDIGTADLGTVEFRWSMVRQVGNLVNEQWIYDPSRPEKVVAVTARHGTAPHLHIQAHENTRQRLASERRPA